MNADDRRKLNAFIEAQSEAIKIDLRRREDQATAALHRANPVWMRSAELAGQLSALERPREELKRIIFPLGIVALGMFVYVLRAEWAHGIGTFIMGFGVWLPIKDHLQISRLNSELRHLREVIRECQFQWESAGASESIFYRQRDHVLREANEIENAPPGDARTSARESWEMEAEALWYERTFRLASRASGTTPPYPDRAS